MDITTIAAQTITFLAPFLIKGGEELVKGVGKDLWEAVKKLFHHDNDQKMLQQFEKTPTDEHYKNKVQYKLEELLEINPELKEQFEILLLKLAFTDKNQQTIMGNKNIGIQDVSGSTITISKG